MLVAKYRPHRVWNQRSNIINFDTPFDRCILNTVSNEFIKLVGLFQHKWHIKDSNIGGTLNGTESKRNPS